MFVLGLLAALVIGAFQLSAAEQNNGSTQGSGWFCPWSGQYGMGPGMMWNRGDWDRGRGWDRRGMMGWRQGCGYNNYNPAREPVTLKQAEALVQDYLTAIGNPNLKQGKLTDKGNYFEVEIVTKNGSLVDTLMLDKQRGWMRSIYSAG